MTRRDILLSLMAGFLSGLFLIPTLAGLNLNFPYKYAALLIVLPFGAMVGFFIAKKLGEKIPVFLELGKFAIIGVLNTSIDFGVLNILILATAQASGISFAFFKASSFVVANINSYFWNKHWTFAAPQSGASIVQSATGREYAKFLVVSLVGLIINVGLALAVVSMGGGLGLSPGRLANVGAVLGSAGNLLWNFLGYKLIVFRE